MVSDLRRTLGLDARREQGERRRGHPPRPSSCRHAAPAPAHLERHGAVAVDVDHASRAILHHAVRLQAARAHSGVGQQAQLCRPASPAAAAAAACAGGARRGMRVGLFSLRRPGPGLHTKRGRRRAASAARQAARRPAAAGGEAALKGATRGGGCFVTRRRRQGLNVHGLDAMLRRGEVLRLRDRDGQGGSRPLRKPPPAVGRGLDLLVVGGRLGVGRALFEQIVVGLWGGEGKSVTKFVLGLVRDGRAHRFARCWLPSSPERSINLH